MLLPIINIAPPTIASQANLTQSGCIQPSIIVAMQLRQLTDQLYKQLYI